MQLASPLVYRVARVFNCAMSMEELAGMVVACVGSAAVLYATHRMHNQDIDQFPHPA